MNQQKNKQSGFSLIEVLISLVIVALLITVGILVYKNQQKSKVNTSSTNTQATKSTTIVSPNTNQNIIKFNQLGVEISVPDSIKSISYTMTGNIVYVTDNVADTNSNNYGGNCSIAALVRFNGQYNANSMNGTLAKQFSTFYITYAHPQAACGNTPTDINQFSADVNAFSSSLSTLTLIP